MTLTKYQLTILKQALLTLATKTTNAYLSDIIIDFNRLDILNSNEGLTDNLIFISRGSGTELNNYDSEEVLYWLKLLYEGTLLNEIMHEDRYVNIKAYIVDIKKLSKLVATMEEKNEHSDLGLEYAPGYSSLIEEDYYHVQCVYEMALSEVESVLRDHNRIDPSLQEQLNKKADRLNSIHMEIACM